MPNSLTRVLVAGRYTKNTLLMVELEENGYVPVVGNLYVKKSALTEIGYVEGEPLELTIRRLEGK